MAYLDARPLPEERMARLRKVFKLGVGQQQQQQQGGDKKGKKHKQQHKGGGEGLEKQEEEEDLEHAIISRVAAKHVL